MYIYRERGKQVFRFCFITVKNKMKCSGDIEIVRDTTTQNQKSKN